MSCGPTDGVAEIWAQGATFIWLSNPFETRHVTAPCCSSWGICCQQHSPIVVGSAQQQNMQLMAPVHALPHQLYPASADAQLCGSWSVPEVVHRSCTPALANGAYNYGPPPCLSGLCKLHTAAVPVTAPAHGCCSCVVHLCVQNEQTRLYYRTKSSTRPSSCQKASCQDSHRCDCDHSSHMCDPTLHCHTCDAGPATHACTVVHAVDLGACRVMLSGAA